MERHLVIIQCDSGHLSGDLIACARYRIYDLRAKADKDQITHILFIIHLPHQVANSTFVSFQGNPWVSYHIDVLRSTGENVITASKAIGKTISALFLGNRSQQPREAWLSENHQSSEINTHELAQIEEDYSNMEVVYGAEKDAVEPMPQIESMETEIGDVPEQFTEMEVVDIESQQEVEGVHELNSPETDNYTPLTRRQLQVVSYPLCYRLHGCIQAAASKLHDISTKRSTKRVEILIRLMPKEPTKDCVSFHGILFQHIYEVLQERDTIRTDEKDWIIREAMNQKSLQHGGTFCNALTRKFDKIVTPIFSEILAKIDQHHNLNLIDPKSQHLCLSQLWLKIFNESQIMNFSYSDMVTPKEQVPGLGARKSCEDFVCQFPFSWLVFEAVNSQWENARKETGGEQAIYNQLCTILEPTAIGEVLSMVDDSNYEYFYKMYLHDFVRLSHSCKHKQQEYENQEYKLISCALDALVHGDMFCSVDGNITLLQRISALHVSYQMNVSRIVWFSLLVSHSPGIMVHLRESDVADRSEMILQLLAVERALVNLALPDKDDPAGNLIPWFNEVISTQNTIPSILNLPCGSQSLSTSHSMIKKLSIKWSTIQVMRIFCEHVVLKHGIENTIVHLRRLDLRLSDDVDFLNKSSLEMIKTHLNRMDKQVKVKDATLFKEDCQRYFVEIVSSHCFGGQRPPDSSLVNMLMEIVFPKHSDTRQLTHLKKAKADKIPMIRSSLLQLLLEHDSDSVREHIEVYLDQSQEILKGTTSHDLYLLCIQCFEDALCKQNFSKGSDSRINLSMHILAESQQALRQFKLNPVFSIALLEGVAGIRFALTEVAHLLHHYQEESIIVSYGQSELLQIAEKVCTDSTINTMEGHLISGPAIFLLKLIVRQFGFQTLKMVSQKFSWIVPPFFNRDNQENVIDPFVIYNDYLYLRGVIAEAVYVKHTKKVTEVTQNLTIKEAAALLLAIFQVITIAYSTREVLLDGDLCELLDQFILNLTSFSSSMRRTARLLLTNKQGGPLAQLCMTPELPGMCKTLGSIVVHTVAVLDSNSGQPMLHPFVAMMAYPADLANAFFPTMPEDALSAVRQAMMTDNDLSGQFVKCPRGHHYFIGDCGHAWVESTCKTCGSKIGGTGHNLVQGNVVETDLADKTKTGHVLGNVESRTATPAPERNLSPPAVCIMRAIMHSALLWCSCHREDVMHDLAPLVKPYVNPENLPEFFWMHLNKDIEHLSRVTGKGMDESAIIVHLVLHEMLLSDSVTITSEGILSSKNAREQWEKRFNNCYIQPILLKLDEKIGAAIDLIANDDKQNQNQLFHQVYERMEAGGDSIEPHLWTYRQRISLEHLGQTLEEKNLNEKYPILHEFLANEASLRATQYLPNIVKLQCSLYDSFHQQKDLIDARRKTIREFLEELKDENSCNEYHVRIKSLIDAYALVGNNLRTHSRLPLEKQHCLSAISEDVSLEYLIPTTSGAGALTTSLVDYLVLTHNNFIEKCCSRVAENNKGVWFKHNIPINQIHRCHLLDYEHQIVSVVLSHCCYSLKLGEAHSVQYDHQALEKHILDKFIHGKPLIISDIPQVVYRRDVYTTVTFDAIRNKVKPQIRLELRVQKEILAELRTPDRLRESLDVVDIVISFLSIGGGKADKSLGEYINKVLKMKRRSFSQKAREYCHLAHILSLWEILSVELSKQTLLQSQEPFDSIKEKYMRKLDQVDIDALDQCLQLFNLDRLLGALFEFIETYVKYSLDNELDWGLVSVIIQEQFKHLDVEGHFERDFPNSITIDQTVAVWKHVVKYQKK